MLWLIALTDKVFVSEQTVSRQNEITEVDRQAEALKQEGRSAAAAELLRAFYGGKVIDNVHVAPMVALKDEVYRNRAKPFKASSFEKPLWRSLDGSLALGGYDEKYFDVVKDPRSDTLFAAVVITDSVVLYKGIVNFGSSSISWSRWVSYYYYGTLHNPSIALDSTHVWVAFSKIYSSSDHDVRILRVNRSDGSTYLYGVSYAIDYEDYPTITTDYEYYSSSWIYMAYWNADKDSVMFVRIEYPDSTVVSSYGGIAYAVGGDTTVNRLSIDYFNSGGSKLLLAYMTNGDTVLLADGSPFGSSWTERSATFGKGYFPYVRGYRGGPYFAVVYTYPFSSSDYDCRLQYSTDAGASFTSYSCSASLDDEIWPTVAFAADTVWVTMLRGDKETPVDSVTDTMYVMVAAHSISGGSWIYRDSINDPSFKYGVLTTWHPVITGPEDTTTGRQFLHVAWSRRFANTGDFDVRTDYHFFGSSTGVVELPQPVNGKLEVSNGSLYVKGNYKVYNTAGRLVAKGSSSTLTRVDLKPGTYFVKTSSGMRTIVVR
ncbi:MAG: T9SS type A sorting domain-containing protein [Thermotogae bacterium]|nr:T9SS type A sorting domain-containing protein [Thermotogota bacterium]